MARPGEQAAEVLPSGRYWRGVLLGYPVVMALVGGLELRGEARWWPWPTAALGVVATLALVLVVAVWFAFIVAVCSLGSGCNLA